MNKKFLISIGGLFILLISVLAVIFLKNKRLPDYNILDAVPVDASIIVQSNELFQLFSENRKENLIWNELVSLKKVEGINLSIDTILNVIGSDPKVEDFIKNCEISFSFHTFGKKLDELLLFQVGHMNEKRLIKEFLSRAAISKPESRKYNQSNIFKYSFSNNYSCYVAFHKGIFFISENSILVENALRQMESEIKLTDNKAFMDVYKTSGKNVEGNVYINLSEFPQVLSLLGNGKTGNKIASFTHFGDWTELDINLKKDALLLNGFTYTSDSVNNYLNLYSGQSPVDMDIVEILPSNTAILTSFGLSEPMEYIKNYKDYLRKQGKYKSRFNKVDQYKSMYGVDVVEILYELMDEEFALFYTDEEEELGFGLVEVQSGVDARQELANYLKKVAKIQDWNYGALKSIIKIDRETSYEIFNMPLPGVLNAAFGDVFNSISNKYFTVIDNFIIFGADKEALKKIIHSYVLKTTLKYDVDFNEFTDFLSSKSNFFFYTNMFRSPYIVADYLNSELSGGIKDNVNTFRKFQAFGYQFRSGSEMIYNNIFLKYIPEVKSEARTVWESHLDTVIDFKPVFVTNHNTKAKEIFVQDMNNNIYLINEVGRIIWKLKMDEKINSEVYQVDYYKNGKLQLLFSTKNKLYLIDRNGNPVEKYPIKLRAESTAGVAVFDYEKNRNYRLCIPCNDRKVYLYSIDGSIISGWEFNKTEGTVTSTPEHIRDGSKDYIVFADEYRIYLLNRRGEIRVNLKDEVQKAQNSKIIYEGGGQNSSPRLVMSSVDGIVKFIYFDGHVEERKLDVELSEMHFFDYQDVNADGLKDFILLDKNKLSVFSNNENKIFFHKFDDDINLAPVYYHFSYGDRKIGVSSRTSGEIFLFNSNGSLYPGFPLNGSTQFSIGFLGNENGHFNLIVGSEHNFLYNYSVN